MSGRGAAGVAPGDAVLHPAPLSHGSGLYHQPFQRDLQGPDEARKG